MDWGLRRQLKNTLYHNYPQFTGFIHILNIFQKQNCIQNSAKAFSTIIYVYKKSINRKIILALHYNSNKYEDMKLQGETPIYC